MIESSRRENRFFDTLNLVMRWKVLERGGRGDLEEEILGGRSKMEEGGCEKISKKVHLAFRTEKRKERMKKG